MIIQFILLIVIAVIVWLLYAKLRSKELTMKQFSAWLLIWSAAAIIVVWPELSVRLANFVGIGRGSDLVVYSALIFIFYFIFRLLMRIEKLEKNLTRVVRQEALTDYDKRQQ